jgi:catechol 2,3-dioxygenase-like lactoylglutathione lyase family enzyme
MILHLDHVTVVVRDVAKATEFFALLGFIEEKSVVISGATFARYMGVDGIEAEHITLISPRATPRFEIQLLRYIQPRDLPGGDVANLAKPGYNHICFAVNDLDAEVKRLTAHGVALRSDVLDFHARKLVFLFGPEDITVELAEWHPQSSPAPQ